MAVASGFAGCTFGKRTQLRTKPANPISTPEAIKWSAVKLNDGKIPKYTYENNMPSAEIKGWNEIKIINKLRENTDKSLGSLQVSEIDGGV